MRDRMHRTAVRDRSAATPSAAGRRVVQRCGDHPCPDTGCSPRVADEVRPVLASVGKPLDTRTRTTMEARFGHDFSQVRVHTDGAAARTAQLLGARAWTVGTHIAFGAGQFGQDGPGQSLLAHELTHVVQQDRLPPTGPLTIEPGDSAAEREAKATETAATQPASTLARPRQVPAAGTVLRHATDEADSATASSASGAAQTRQGAAPAASAGGRLSANTVECVLKYIACRAPYNPGSWAAKVTYHCPVFPGTPGTTAPAYVTIPDEYIGKDDAGQDQYRCRPRSSVVNRLEIGDAVATGLTRTMLFPDFASCHAGFRANLALALSVLFDPSGGDGHTWGGRVNQAPPPDFPCP